MPNDINIVDSALRPGAGDEFSRTFLSIALMI